jgi:hypothetical protein
VKLNKNAGRVDHVLITVSYPNFADCIDKLSRALGVVFEPPIIRADFGVISAISLESGLEVLAPTREEGPFWERIQRRGEGHVSIIFGVDNFDEARKRATEAGVAVGAEIGLLGDEPWGKYFSVFREARLAPVCGATIILGEIEPK